MGKIRCKRLEEILLDSCDVTGELDIDKTIRLLKDGVVDDGFK